MKTATHPDNYRIVVFEDLNDGTQFMTRSTAPAEESTKIDGVDYPLIKVHISAASHPFFTGQEKLVDIEGRVDKFEKRRASAAAAQKARSDKAVKPDRKEKEEAKGAPAKIGNLKQN